MLSTTNSSGSWPIIEEAHPELATANGKPTHRLWGAGRHRRGELHAHRTPRPGGCSAGRPAARRLLAWGQRWTVYSVSDARSTPNREGSEASWPWPRSLQVKASDPFCPELRQPNAIEALKAGRALGKGRHSHAQHRNGLQHGGRGAPQNPGGDLPSGPRKGLCHGSSRRPRRSIPAGIDMTGSSSIEGSAPDGQCGDSDRPPPPSIPRDACCRFCGPGPDREGRGHRQRPETVVVANQLGEVTEDPAHPLPPRDPRLAEPGWLSRGTLAGRRPRNRGTSRCPLAAVGYLHLATCRPGPGQ